MRKSAKYFLIIASIGLLIGGWWSYKYLIQEPEPKTKAIETNDVPTMYDSLEEQKKALSTYGNLLKYVFEGREDEIEEGSYIIPGLLATKTLMSDKGDSPSMCTTMTTQGVTTTENYVIISAYCHGKVHNSVLYVLDKSTHKYIKTIVLEGRPHVGGITYDYMSQKIWISSSKYGIAQVVGIDIQTLENYDFSQNHGSVQYHQTIDLPDIRDSSFISYHDSALYIGSFSRSQKGLLEKYLIDEKGHVADKKEKRIELYIEKETVTPNKKETIMSKVQGITFYKDYILLSRSYGHIAESELVIFKDTDKDRIMLDSDNNEDYIKTIKLPEHLEQIHVEGNDLYMLFESASYPFRSQKSTHVDRVLKLDLLKFIKE